MDALASTVLRSKSSLAALGVCILVLAWIRRKKSARYELPPGPPADPIIGHLRIMPIDYQWKVFAEWGKKWGDVIYVSIVGRPTLIINSSEAARDLMDRRGANYSDRPRLVLLGEMMGWGQMITFMGYGDRFRRQRRLMQQYFNSQAIHTFRPLQTEQVKVFLRNILDDPGNFRHLINRLTAATLVKATYGHDVLSDDDKYAQLAVEATSRAVSAGVPGATLVDFFPFLRYIPSWFPGGGFKREAEITRKLTEDMVNEPYNDVREQRIAGTAIPSLMSRLLDDYESWNAQDSEHEINMKNVGGVIYSAGVETSEVVVATFFLIMTCYPDVVRRAQEEIDQVVGKYRLPNLEDRRSLPYIDCIMKEILRFNPPIPLGIPHQSIEEDIYRGKRIPAGTLILPNIWQMMRDESYFPRPHEFNPERFMKKVEETDDILHALNGFSLDDPSSIVFGFGRRICPGRYFVDASIWLIMANVLAVFDIRPPVDPITGKEVKPNVEFSSGATSQPLPFKCIITPRNERCESLIREDV